MATDTPSDGGGDALDNLAGVVVVGTAIDVSGLKRQSRTKLRQVAEAAGGAAGGAMGKAMGDAAAAGAEAGGARAARQFRRRGRFAKEGEGAGDEFGKGVGEGADKAINRGPLSGDRVAERYTRAMERVLRNRQAEIRAAQAGYLMTPKQAEEAGLEAARAYDRAILRGMGRLREGRTTGRGRTAMGRDATARMAETFILPRPNPARSQRDGEAVAQRYIAGLRRRLDADAARIKADLLDNLISPREAERRGREAGEKYQRALLRSMRRMQAEGRLSSGAASAFGSAMIDTRAFGEEIGKLGGAPGIFSRIAQSAKTWIAGVFVAALFAAAGALRGLISTLEDAKERITAGLRLEAASKLYGVPLKDLKRLAGEAREEFELTAGQAANLATQVGKIAGRAQESARAQDLLNAAMDLGAANGLTLAEIVDSLDQTYRGMDDGLNKLGLSDPSQIFKEFAKAAGTTADKLSDAQKQQAMMNAIIAAGARVQGQYSRQMQGDIGTLQQFENRIKGNREEIGLRFLPIAAEMAQRLNGPMAGAVRLITSLLDHLTSSLDRVIRKMHEMGVAAARIAPYEAERSIREGREQQDRLRPDMARLAERVGIETGTDWGLDWPIHGGGTVRGGHYDMNEINRARERARAVERYWENIARNGRVPGSRAPDLDQARAMAPVNPGNERGTEALIRRASQGDRAAATRLLSDAQNYRMATDELHSAVTAYVATGSRIADLEADMPRLVANAQLQEQLDDVNRATDALLRTAEQAAAAKGVTGEAWARLTEQQRVAHLSDADRARFTDLRTRADALDVQINGPAPAAPTTPTAPAEISTEAKGARQALRELVAELQTVAQFRNAVGEPFRTLEEVPAQLRGAITEIVSLEREIAEVEDKIRKSGQGADPAVQRHLAALRGLVGQRRESAQKLRDELATNGELISDSARQVRDGLSDAAAGFRMLQATGLGRDAPEAMVQMVGEVVRLDEQLVKARRDMAALAREGQQPPPGTLEWVAHLESQRSEAVAVLATFKQLRDVLQDLPGLTADQFQGMDPSEMEAMTAILRTQAANLRLVREAEERLFNARQQHGTTSRQAKEAERDLIEVRKEARRALYALIMAVRASTLSTQEQARFIALLRGEIEKLEGTAEKTANDFDAIFTAAMSVVRSLAAVGNELEVLNEKQVKVIEGFAEMAENAIKFAASVKTGNVPGAIQAGIGFIEGAIKFHQGLTGESEAQMALRGALTDLRESIDALNETIISDRSTREVAEDRQELSAAGRILAGDEDRMARYAPTRRGSLADLAVEMGLADAGASKAAQIEALRRWAEEIDAAYGSNLAWFVENSRPNELMAGILSLEHQLGRELGEMGGFGSDVAGVLAAINYELDILGNSDAAEGIRRKTQALLASANNLGEFVDEFTELAGLDLSTVAGQARRDEIVRAMLARMQAGQTGSHINFGDMTPDQFRELLAEWARAEAGDGSGETNSEVVNRSVTEVTGNRLVGWLATIAHYARRMYEFLTGDVGPGPELSPGGAGPTDTGGSAPAGPTASVSFIPPAASPLDSVGGGGGALLSPLAALAAESARVLAAPHVLAALAASMPRGERGGAAGTVIHADVTVALSVTGEAVTSQPEHVGERMGVGIRRGLGDLADEALGERRLQQMRSSGNGHAFSRSVRK